jgi:hypothetical protein
MQMSRSSDVIGAFAVTGRPGYQGRADRQADKCRAGPASPVIHTAARVRCVLVFAIRECITTRSVVPSSTSAVWNIREII